MHFDPIKSFSIGERDEISTYIWQCKWPSCTRQINLSSGNPGEGEVDVSHIRSSLVSLKKKYIQAICIQKNIQENPIQWNPD